MLIAIATAIAVASGIAEEVNLRDWLAGNGIDVAGCVSGEGHLTDYAPAVLFDGITEPENPDAAKKNRWLVNEDKGSFAGFATIAAPETLFANQDEGLVLARYRIWRYSSKSDIYNINRAPATWVLYGSNDGTSWEIVDEQAGAFDWSELPSDIENEPPAYIEVEVPEGARKSYRQFKFKPTASHASWSNPNGIMYEWQIGAMELELFVEPMTVSSRFSNLREVIRSAGVDIASCVTDGDSHSDYPATKLFDGAGMGVVDTSLRWLAAQWDFSKVHATIKIPDAVINDGSTGFILRGYRMWRNVNGEAGLKRAPTAWIVYGSNDGINWTEMHSQSAPVSWGEKEYSKVFALPSNGAPWRFIRFVPQGSSAGANYVWKTGLQEIEYFVERTEENLVNIRDIFANAGVSASAYITGAGAHATYPVERLFDGFGADGEDDRWLAGEESLKDVYATLRIPRTVLPDDVGGYVVKKIRLWRTAGNDSGMNVVRGPTTWIFEGSQNGRDWSTLQKQSTLIKWDHNVFYYDVYVANNEMVFKYLRFSPLTSDCVQTTYTWKVGLREIEYFAVPVPGSSRKGMCIRLR